MRAAGPKGIRREMQSGSAPYQNATRSIIDSRIAQTIVDTGTIGMCLSGRRCYAANDLWGSLEKNYVTARETNFVRYLLPGVIAIR